MIVFLLQQNDEIMTHKEELKIAKAEHKQALKNKVLYKDRRNAILHRLVGSQIPKWGSIKIIVTEI